MCVCEQSSQMLVSLSADIVILISRHAPSYAQLLLPLSFILTQFSHA